MSQNSFHSFKKESNVSISLLHLFDEKKSIKRGRFEKEFEEFLKKVVVTSDLKLFVQHLLLISRNLRKNYITAENKFEIGFERETTIFRLKSSTAL
jgi:hypothetical protein